MSDKNGDTRVSPLRAIAPAALHNALATVVDAYGAALASQDAKVQALEAEVAVQRQSILGLQNNLVLSQKQAAELVRERTSALAAGIVWRRALEEAKGVLDDIADSANDVVEPWSLAECREAARKAFYAACEALSYEGGPGVRGRDAGGKEAPREGQVKEEGARRPSVGEAAQAQGVSVKGDSYDAMREF